VQVLINAPSTVTLTLQSSARSQYFKSELTEPSTLQLLCPQRTCDTHAIAHLSWDLITRRVV
jgi:hypothetical protein